MLPICKRLTGQFFVFCLAAKDDTNINSLIIRAQTNEAKAECLLGLYYIHGLNVTQDYTNGLKWLSKSADQGFPPAEYALGILFKSGLGVPTNRPTADRWFQKASDQGYVPAEHEAALIADRNGNRDEALKLLRDAAQKGFPFVPISNGLYRIRSGRAVLLVHLVCREC